MAKATRKSGGHYEVGYRKPPKAHRFKGGQSGNPRGRPKGQSTTEELFLREAARLVRIRAGNAVVQITKRGALARKLFQMALEGDIAACRLLLQMLAQGEAIANERAGPDAGQGPEFLEGIIPDDEALRRMLSRFGQLLQTKGED
jgi:hypothetical protein